MNRKSAGRPASRARCLRLAPGSPRWTDFSGTVSFSHFSKSSAYPPLWDLAGANAVGRRERTRRPIPWRAAGAPGPYGLGRRDGWYVPPVMATAPTWPDVSGPAPQTVPAHLRRHLCGCPRVRAPSSARPRLGQGALSLYSYRNFVKHLLPPLTLTWLASLLRWSVRRASAAATPKAGDAPHVRFRKGPIGQPR